MDNNNNSKSTQLRSREGEFDVDLLLFFLIKLFYYGKNSKSTSNTPRLLSLGRFSVVFSNKIILLEKTTVNRPRIPPPDFSAWSIYCCP